MTLSKRDFQAFNAAINGAFSPNPALQGALTAASLVDAKHAKAKSFYEHDGFIACADAPMTLYLPLG